MLRRSPNARITAAPDSTVANADANRARLEISNLAVTLQRPNQDPVHLVEEVSLTIEPGEIVGMVGESGSGKTMTSLAVMRLLPRYARASGSIRFGGRELLDLTEDDMRDVRGSEVGMVFQEPVAALNPVFTVWSQLGSAIRAHHKLSKREARSRAIELLHMVGLPEPEQRLKQYPHELSGGMAQRVMLAMALSSGAKLLLADEPTTSLDVTIQDDIIRLIQKLAAETGIGVLFISHDLGLVSRISDRVAVMYAGQIVESGPTRVLLEAPMHPYTQALVRCVPDLDQVGVVRRGIPGAPPVPGSVPSGCRFRSRCEFAATQCELQQTLDQVDSVHAVRCIRAPELATTQPAAVGR